MRFPDSLYRVLLLLIILAASPSVFAETFTVKDIRVEGLQRISAGTVFNYLPVQIGQTIESDDTGEIIRALYKTGFFKDVRLEREGGILVIYVHERPAIAKIDIDGNKSIDDEPLLQALKDIGLAEGRVFNRSVLDRIERELHRQYYALGKYGMALQSTVTPLERNRVAIYIDITEGAAARIKQINIVGNNAFDDDDLLDEMKLNTGGWLSVFTKDNQYSRQKLAGDLETLKSFYLDRGYINFKIQSTQVTISPNKEDIYITINVHEGDIYTISDIRLAGNLVLNKEEFFPLIHISRGEVFSRKKTVESSQRINELMGDNGFAFANVNSIPNINKANKTVAVTFFVDPGKRVYVRRINLSGNTKTRDEVLRREFRQMESAWFSGKKVKLSKQRLQRTGFFEEVNLETKPVPGSTDQVDVNVRVKEKSSGSLMAGIGYSQSQGFMFSSSLKQDNFLGTGKQVALAFSSSDVNTLYQLAYTNPYYTIDGISRGFTLRYQDTDFEDAGVANFSTATSLAGVNFGIPLNEFDRLGFRFDMINTEMTLGSSAPSELTNFVAQNGNEYLNFKLSMNWTHDSRDHHLMPNSGGKKSFNAQITTPGSDLEYYKIGYKHKHYFPVIGRMVLSAKIDVAYADSYGSTNELPFYETYYAGGPKSVRGFESNSLGPRGNNNNSSSDPIGGNLKTVGSLELYFPPPFKVLDQSVRIGAFVDVGNVFDDSEFEAGELRSSVGLSAFWLSPIGPLTVSMAAPINSESGDKDEMFQFSLGSAF